MPCDARKLPHSLSKGPPPNNYSTNRNESAHLIESQSRSTVRFGHAQHLSWSSYVRYIQGFETTPGKICEHMVETKSEQKWHTSMKAGTQVMISV